MQNATAPVSHNPLSTIVPGATTPGSATTLQTVPEISPGSMLTQVGSTLGGILLLILLVGWLLRRFGFAPQRNKDSLLKVTASCQVGQRERVVIVKTDNTWLVLGVTAQQITLLHTLAAPPPDLDEPTTAHKSADFRQLLQKVLKRPEKSA